MELTLEPPDDLAIIHVPPQLSVEFADDMAAQLARAAEHPRIRVVALVGCDDRTFSRGLDLEGVLDARVAVEPALAAVTRCLTALHAVPRATLAIVRGEAIGGGVGLAAACDHVIATEGATFALPELLWGFVPAAIWPIVAARIGTARARRWMLDATARSADEAREAGLADVVVSAGALARELARAVRRLARPIPDAVALLRRWSAESERLAVPDAIVRGGALTAQWLARDDVRARLARFFQEGRAPWQAD